ncbi:hypothetical protein CY35_08G070100 [Sphagnum magellanicum]|nr:hypothetical protein CY35_08G070100 [Sphagnum magellanicum]
MWASNVSSACGTDFILLRFSNCDLFSHHASSSSSSRSSSSSSSSTVSLLPSALCFPSEAGPASASSSTGGGGGGRGVLRVCGKRGKCLVVGNRRPHRILDYGGGTGEFRVFATADVEKSDAVVQPKLESVEVKEAVKLDRKAADWKKAEKGMESGAIHKGRIDACNSGGLLVRFGSLQGFLPFSQMTVARLPKDGSKTLAEVAKELVGELIFVKIIEVNEEERRLIFSEKQASLIESLRQIQVGSIFDGKVNSVADFGAFVDLQLPDGSYPVSGLIHVSELSWDPVRNPRDLLEEGQMVRVKVIQVDLDRMRLALSMKQLQADPLLETLDTLMPVEAQEGTLSTDSVVLDAELLATALPGLEQICAEMLQEEGIKGITLGRQKLEQRVVSQDLELWLSNEPVEDGKFSLLARAGRQVQEVQLNTELDREGVKAAVQRVTGRVP